MPTTRVPPSAPPFRLLIADDDAAIAEMLGQSARVLWPDCAVATAPDGATALRHFAAQRPDLVLLDVTMPAPDGFAVCRQMRRADTAVPILMVTGRSAVLDEVRALDAGADGYVAKPFDPLCLLARLRALARRAGVAPTKEPSPRRADVPVGALAIDLAAREVRVQGERVALTPTEWVLLEALAQHAGQIVPQEDLTARVWSTSSRRTRRALKVYIHRLRWQLGDDGPVPRYIETRRNQGYRLAAPHARDRGPI